MSRKSLPDWSHLEQLQTLWAAPVPIIALTVGFGIMGWAVDLSALVSNALDNARDTRNHL